MEYSIKKYEHKYLLSCAELVKDTWDLHSSYVGLTDLEPIYIAYVKDCIDYSVHLEIIVDDNDIVCGMLFGGIENPPFSNQIKVFINRVQTNLWVALKWLWGAFGDRKIALNNFQSHDKIENDGEKYSGLFDGEVNLFIVSKELRGKQFGYKLMNRYVNFCIKNHLKTIFLWTELGCTYSFYERYGFERYSTFHNKNLTYGNKTQDNGFIYCYDIKAKSQVEKNIYLAPIDNKIESDILSLSVTNAQKEMIEPIEECLHDAKISAYGMKWDTLAILLDHSVIGFAMYGVWHDIKGKDDDEVWIDRFMIDKRFQGNGYGKIALKELISMLISKYDCDEIYLSVFKNNHTAIALYKKLGFKSNGEREEKGERVMVLEL